MPVRVIALDPGALTGWAAADIDETGEWSNLQHGILGEKEVVLMLADSQGFRAVQPDDAPAFDVIVYEDWVLYRKHVEEYVGSDMPYSQQIGQYRLIAWLSNTPIVKQGAARKQLALRQARAFWPELADKVEAIQQRAHKNAHDGDALLHLWGYTVDHFNVRKHT